MRKGWVAVTVLILSLLLHTAARAEDAAVESIRLTPDTTKILRLDEDATSVIVANPDHASVVLDSPRLLVVMPRQPGTTLFTVLNATGKTILEKNIIVSGTAQPQYVRVRRACGPSDPGCAPNSYYYCPDGCYEVTAVGTKQGGSQSPPIISSGTGASARGEDVDINAPPLPQADEATEAADAPQPPPPSEEGGGPQVVDPSNAGGN